MNCDQICAQRQFTREENIEANIFAQELLMPEELFREKAVEHGYSVIRLSGIFGVSKAHVLTRLITLGLPYNS